MCYKQQGTDDFPIAFYHIEPTDTRYEMPYHWHHQIEIIRVIKGVFHLIINGAVYDLHEGEAVYIQDGLSHGGTPEECIYECVVFDLKIVQKSEYRTGRFLRYSGVMLIQRLRMTSMQHMHILPNSKKSSTISKNIIRKAYPLTIWQPYLK